MVMSPDGANVTRLAEGGAPAWSPDGRWLAMIFSGSEGSETELRIVGPDGQGLQTVLKQAYMTKVAWSPAGDYLLYTFFKPDQQPDQFVEQFGIVRVDGTGMQELSQPDERHLDPQWSPSGGQLLYTVTVGRDYDKRELWMTDLDSRAQQLTRLQNGSIFDASWSPSLPETVMATWLQGIAEKTAAEDRRNAEAEAQRQAEEDARRKAAAEDRLKATEDRLKAAEDHLKAAAEDRLNAEAEAQRKAEEDARRKAEAEARRLATLAFQQGLTFASSGRIDESIQEFSAAIERDPTYAIAYANRGVAYLAQKKYNKALDDLKQAVALNPKDPLAFYNLAVLYTLRKDFDLAIDTLDQALTHGFNNYDALRHDPDLAGLRKQSEFRKLLDRHKIFR
jgi:Flp pilus assembly protein TadD